MFHCDVNLELTKIIKAEMSSGPYFSEWRWICNSCNARRRREEADFQMLWLSLRDRIHYPFKYFQQKLHRCQISEQKLSSLLSNSRKLDSPHCMSSYFHILWLSLRDRMHTTLPLSLQILFIETVFVKIYITMLSNVKQMFC